MTGAEYIAAFLARAGCRHVHAMTGGACAFMLDAVGRHPALELVCFQHEQAAAMAADAVWRVSRRVGVTMATSGPGATNLITGIACSFFDSIPSLHITGQVNQRESSAVHGAKVRQSGFQETRIVDMVRPVVKYAVLVRNVEELRRELAKGLAIALSGRMGPVLIDVPMDVQQAEMPDDMPEAAPVTRPDPAPAAAAAEALGATLAAARRPLVLWGGGVNMAGAAPALARWLAQSGLPFVASWAGLDGFDHAMPGFLGQIGVYGNRGANFALQNADTVIVLGSRLDNRQRSGNPANFATGATVHVFDVDPAELQKYGGAYRTTEIDLQLLPEILAAVQAPPVAADWQDYLRTMKARYHGRETSSSALRLNSLSPYDVVRRIRHLIAPDAIVAADTGAALCWLYQAFEVSRHRLFTAGGNSPMGYALCAAIGAKLEAPERQVVSYNGDGGFQVNLQELETVRRLGLDIAIVVMNNGSYGIIKQFQDSYLGGRYTGSQLGYSAPDFGRIAEAYGIRHARVERLEDMTPDLFRNGPTLIDVILSDQTLIEPKLEMGRPINDQYPYLADEDYAEGNRFVAYPRPPGFAGGRRS
ncbi:thiamine pyrophosphate-binding protein [Aestuariivirga litoralis]|uniref:Thiamine pyrophosphate-binding protein n=1 Tax=Aestuariivirga litoralis TaxID=2650924 RepID=A0A2W2ATM2_9HYPH|nr:thiamine pyrophosphate-binding protein [Aestuariivirga litoralis]PZF78615.1 thiamine pyrophosphate-binding protein [Aestuariivirga litoralis]